MHIYQSIVVLYVEDGSPVAKLPLHVGGPRAGNHRMAGVETGCKEITAVDIVERIDKVDHPFHLGNGGRHPFVCFWIPGKHVFNAHHYACIPERRHHCPVKLKVHSTTFIVVLPMYIGRGGLPDE